MHELVQKKLDQYGIKIYDSYDIEEEKYFNCENMLIISNEKLKKVAVSFNAFLKPEHSSKLTVMLTQIINPIEIMESHIYDEKNVPIFGDEAYNKINEIKSNEVDKSAAYMNILSNMDDNECFQC